MGAKRNKNKPQQTAPVNVLPVKKPDTASAVAGFVAWGFTALMLLGYIAFRTEGTLARGNKMSVDRAMFTVVNGSTLTGFQLNLAVDHYNPRGQWIREVQIHAGDTVRRLPDQCRGRW